MVHWCKNCRPAGFYCLASAVRICFLSLNRARKNAREQCPIHPCIVLVLRKKDFYLLAEMYLGIMKGWIRHYFRFYSGSTKVLPGPPKYLLHQCPHRARPVPEIVPEIVPDPPLHSAQIVLAVRKKDFYVF